MSSKELIATWDSSREALVEVRKGKIHKGKKLRKIRKKTQETAEKNSANGMNIPQVKIHKSEKNSGKVEKTQEMAEKNSEKSKMTHKLGIQLRKQGKNSGNGR